MSVFLDIDQNLFSIFNSSPLPSYHKTRLNNLLKQMDVVTAGQLLSFVPQDYEHRDTVFPLYRAHQENKKVLVKVTVLQHKYLFLPRRGRVLQIVVQDEHKDGVNTAELHCYGRDFLYSAMPVGSSHYIWGKFTVKYKKLITSDFELVTMKHRRNTIVAKYRLSGYKITANMFSLAVKTVLEHVQISDLHNYHRKHIKTTQKNLADLSRKQACWMLHFPRSDEDIETARTYFAIDEMLLFQLSLQYTHRKNKKNAEKHITETNTEVNTETKTQANLPFLKTSPNYVEQLQKKIPFSLTTGQKKVIDEIVDDMKKNTPMRRLLQGDVGSGKTIVALFTALHLLEREKNVQVCFVVPSEALALQHYKTIKSLCDSLNIEVVCLTGSTSAPIRRKITAELAHGKVQCIIGTHALYSKTLVYNNLCYAIIDEQHRFGIKQRSLLLQKGKRVHTLLMSATPIPRSLALTLYSGVDISTLTERPALRKKVTTRLVLQERVLQVYTHVKKRLDKNEQAFFVFPQIETNEDEDIKKNIQLSSAEDNFHKIKEILSPHSVTLLHSRVSESERVHALEKFAEGKISALVCTTIVEVGIDVPNANLMCVFEAQRFGLATLHQLRGRVGRGDSEGEAIFLYRKPLSEIAKERLKTIYNINDGFKIAEKDLILRGPGDINQMGSRQSGAVLFQFTNIASDIGMLQQLNICAKEILDKDPELENESHRRLKYYVSEGITSV